MKKNSYLRGAALLAASVVFAKILGAVYRIPLTNIIGAEGMGIYQFVYPVFALILTLSSGAVPTAISITVSKSAVLNDDDRAKNDFAVALKICFLIGLTGSLFLVLLSYPLSLAQSTEAFLGYLVVAPAVFIVTVISAFRGWFMGHKNMVPPSVSQITEGIVKLASGITLTKILLPFGLKYAVAGALGGVVASEMVTLIIMFFMYLRRDKKIPRVKLKENKEALKNLWILALPLILSGMILPLSQFLDSVLLVNLLKLGGKGIDATKVYGIYTGTVSPLINLPVMVCITMGIAITPQMVEGKARRDVDYIMDKASTATKMIFVICVPFVLLFVFMNDGIIKFLYPKLSEQYLILGADLLALSAVNVLALSIFQIYSAMLQGLDKTYVPLKIMVFCMAFKLVLSVILVPFIGIMGAALASAIGYTLAGAIIMVYFGKFVRPADNLVKNSSLIALCGVIMSMIIVLNIRLQKNPVSMILLSSISIAVYFVFLLILRVFTKEELGSLPFGKFLLKMDAFIHR